MAWIDTLTQSMEQTLDTKWNSRDGNVVPETQDIVLKDGAVNIEATFLYADLAGSSTLAQKCPWETTAKIIRAYLDCCTRSIRKHDGHIRSFDGDRVMGVFKHDSKNTSAAQCAREIDWMIENVLNPFATKKFPSIQKNTIYIKHCIGIDMGYSHAVRAGIRNNSDTIWIGKAPSFAAKLSDIREHPYSVYLSEESYKKIADSGKIVNGQNIWESRSFEFAGTKETVYRTKYMYKP